MQATTLNPQDAQQQVAESLPELEARMRAQFHAYYDTMTKVVRLRQRPLAAEAAAPYGKKHRRAGRGRGPTPPPGSAAAVPPGGEPLGPVAGGGA